MTAARRRGAVSAVLPMNGSLKSSDCGGSA